ncbi:ankyrin repeat domain-containing protein [Solirubrobacter taibaiensis]|nr:ankyrin repeat domain-containing protein [Solirubrobacter taibaiensis]
MRAPALEEEIVMQLSLEQARRRAKELLRSGSVAPRDDRPPRLADAQRQVANDLGFRSWPALVHYVEGSRDRLVAAALSGRADLVEGYLKQRPELARHIEVALVIGAIEPVRAALRDPEFANRELTHGHKPFELPVFSACRRTARADDLRRVLALLLDHGASLPGAELLTFTLSFDDLETVRVLLEHGDLTPADPELRDALTIARDPAIAELLIAHGAALDARDQDGLTPYSHAARFRSKAMLELLEAHGGSSEFDPAAAWIGAVVRGEPAGPRPPLRWADAEQLPRWASAGEDEIVGRLLDAGVPVDSTGAEGGTALHYAASWGQPSTCELLLAHGADVHHDANGTPLLWLAWGSVNQPNAAERVDRYVAAADVLLRQGARATPGMVDLAADAVRHRLDAVSD